MKIRYGFVTNSSSTSYTIVVKDKAPEGYFTLLDLLQIAYNRVELEAIDEFGGLYFKKGGNIDERDLKVHKLDEYIRNAENNLDWKEKIIPEMEDEAEKLRELMKLDDDSILMFSDKVWGEPQSRSGRIKSAKENLSRRLSWKERDIEKYKKELEFDKKQLAVLKEYKGRENEDYVVLFVDMDHWSHSIEALIEKSKCEILKKERT